MNSLKESIQYYVWASYRRKLLDRLQEKYTYLYRGVVLDVGGRDRGRFRKPRNKVKQWIFADIERKHNPDIILNVTDMKQVIKEGSIDVINSIELFEHIDKPKEGLEECYRVLNKGGIMILSVPFLYGVHADPYDFQRWTLDKWKLQFKKTNFHILKIEIMGFFFTVLGDMLREFIKSLPMGVRQLCYGVYPLLDILVLLDRTNVVKKHKKLNKYHGGYFIIIHK